MLEGLNTKLEYYALYLQVDCGMTVHTIELKSRILKKFLLEMNTLEPTHMQLRHYVGAFYNQKYSSTHITDTLGALEHYFACLGNPIRLGRPKKTKTLVEETLTEAEVTLVLAACSDT